MLNPDINIYKGKVWLSALSERDGVMHDVVSVQIASEEDLTLALRLFHQELSLYADDEFAVFAKIFRRIKGGGVIKWQVFYDGMDCRVERYDYDRRINHAVCN